MAVRLNSQEAGGFKLLEEDAMDDRPCAAVKKFVTSVLDRKDMKDQDVASSFRNLMEYRDWTSSPSACSVATNSSAMDGDRLNSPPSPPSPSAMPGAGGGGGGSMSGSSSRDDQRLPNELLDEICEDIGMKEGMELDFVEFLMEQDTNPHAYMTQEAISSGAYNSAAGSTISTPTGSGSGMGSRSGSNSGNSGTGSQHSNKDGSNNNNNKASANLNSNNNNNNNNDTSKGSLTLLGPPSSNNNNNTNSSNNNNGMAPNFLFKPNFNNDTDWLKEIPSPLINSGPSSGANTVVSSENNSPAQKRLHLSVSTDTSPHKGRSQTPPGFNQPKSQHQHQNSNNNNSAFTAFGGSSSSGGMVSDSGFNQDSYNNASIGHHQHHHNNNHHQSYFKMPPPAVGPGPSVMAKRSHSYPQGAPASSPVHSLGSQGSSASSTHSLSNNNQSRGIGGSSSSTGSSISKPDFNEKSASDSSDIEDAMGGNSNNNNSSVPPSSVNNNNNNNSNISSNNNNNNNNVDSIKKESSGSPMNDVVPSSPCDFARPSSPGGSKGSSMTQQQQQQMGGGRDSSVFQRVGGSMTQGPQGHGPQGQPPPNVNVKTMQHMQQNRWMNQKQTGGQHQPHPMDSTYPHHPHPHPHQQQASHPHQQHPPHHPGFYNKTMYPGAPFQQVHGPPMPHPPSGPVGPPHLTTVRTAVDSPLDQGYFSNESAGNCSNGSAPSPAFTSSSLSSFSSISTMMPADQHQQQQQQHQHHHHQHHQQHSQQHSHHPHQYNHQQQQQPQKSALIPQQQDGNEMPNARPPGQKSVHFADGTEGGTTSPPSSVDVKPTIPTTATSYNVAANQPPTPPDCAFADSMECSNSNNNNNSVANQQQPKGTMPSGKILPRYNHHGMKSGVAPYTVPNSQGQVMGPGLTSQNYDFNNRSSCAMSASSGGPTGGVPPVAATQESSCAMAGNESMQQPHQHHPHGYSGMQQHGKQMPGGGFYNMEGSNQSMMRTASGGGAAAEPMPDYPNQNQTPTSQMRGDYPMAGHGHYSMQTTTEQMQNQQQAQNNMSIPQQQQQQPQNLIEPSSEHEFSSCSQQQQQQQQPSEFSHHHPHPQHHHPHPHQNMQISSAHPHQNSSFQQMPIAMSTPMPNRPQAGSYNTSTNNPAAMCPPGYDSSFSHPHPHPHHHHHRPEAMYPPQSGPPPQPQAAKGWGVSGQPQPPQQQQPTEELHVQIPPQSPMKAGGMPQPPPPPQIQPGLPNMQPSPTPGCAAPMGPLPPSHMQQHPQGPNGPHPEYGPCVGMNCTACKMAAQNGGVAGPQPQTHPNMCKMYPLAPPHPHSHPHHMSSQPGTHHPHQVGTMCPNPNCPSCKANNQSRPPILSSQQKFLQHLIMDESNSAYRSHPLFPLLRDLVIAEANFDNPRFHYQQLLSTLPNDLQKLLQNFLQRNRPSGQYQSNQAVESVIMDGLRLAHTNLVDKIRQRHEMEKMKASTASLRSMEEFCQKFDHSINGPMGRPGVPNGMGPMGMGHPMAGYGHDGSYIQPGIAGPLGFRPLKDGPDHMMDGHMATSSPQANKTESKKHPSLPKEAVAMMMEWLRNHKDNPYPNDDEKAMLIKQTGLSINQINYWFTNARRRILPKWAQCKT